MSHTKQTGRLAVKYALYTAVKSLDPKPSQICLAYGFCDRQFCALNQEPRRQRHIFNNSIMNHEIFWGKLPVACRNLITACIFLLSQFFKGGNYVSSATIYGIAIDLK